MLTTTESLDLESVQASQHGATDVGIFALSNAHSVAIEKAPIENKSFDVQPANTVDSAVALTKASLLPKSKSAAEKTGGATQEVASSYAEPHVYSFQALATWDGYVVETVEDRVVVRLTNLASPHQSESEEAEIPLQELDDDLKAQLTPGRFFRWTIGYELTRGGQKTRASRFAVRQMPSFNRSDLAKAEEEAKRIALSVTWD